VKRASFLNPPGLVDDFARRPALEAAFAEAWDAWLGRSLDDSAASAKAQGGRFRRPNSMGDAPARKAIAWDAFPKALARWYEDGEQPDELRWRVAEVPRPMRYGRTRSGKAVTVLHRQQDEYCEWFVRRDAEGRIERVDFTSEGPEYWLFLAHGTNVLYRELDDPPPFTFDGDLSLVVELYREHVSEDVDEADLVWPTDVRVRRGGKWEIGHRKGEYNPFNRWNTTHGAMHLTHPSSTLAAEIRLASDGAVVRTRGGRIATDPDELICCSGYGDANRSSDPTIGATVNELARAGYAIALADPIGLYISELDLDAFVGPNDEDVSDAWTVDRGDGDRILRAHFGRSEAAGVPVESILAEGTPIRYGGQIADAIQMVLVGEAGDQAEPPRGAPGPTKCCKEPNGKPIEAVIERESRCADVDWSPATPYTGADDEERVGEPADDELEDSDFVSLPVTRARHVDVRL